MSLVMLLPIIWGPSACTQTPLLNTDWLVGVSGWRVSWLASLGCSLGSARLGWLARLGSAGSLGWLAGWHVGLACWLARWLARSLGSLTVVYAGSDAREKSGRALCALKKGKIGEK